MLDGREFAQMQAFRRRGACCLLVKWIDACRLTQKSRRQVVMQLADQAF